MWLLLLTLNGPARGEAHGTRSQLMLAVTAQGCHSLAATSHYFPPFRPKMKPKDLLTKTAEMAARRSTRALNTKQTGGLRWADIDTISFGF